MQGLFRQGLFRSESGHRFQRHPGAVYVGDYGPGPGLTETAIQSVSTDTVITDKPLVSIIVPVFNVADYIDDGLHSILQQDFSAACEVILVDDCSTDGSIDTCRRYASEHADKFHLIECAQNAGVSTARNLGLERARGRYLMFLDPDDVLPPSAVRRLFETAEEYAADIVKGNLVLFDEQGRKPAPDRVTLTTLLEGEAVLTALYEHRQVRGHIAGKLLRRDRFGEMRLLAGVRMAQDLLYFSEVFARARSLVLLGEDVYFYRKHGSGSTGRKYEKGSYVDWLDAVETAGRFASSPRQKRAHKSLMLRTMTQIARECRKIPADHAAQVLDLIDKKCAEWELRLISLILRDRLGLRDLSRYVKMRLAIRKIRKNLSRV